MYVKNVHFLKMTSEANILTAEEIYSQSLDTYAGIPANKTIDELIKLIRYCFLNDDAERTAILAVCTYITDVKFINMDIPNEISQILSQYSIFNKKELDMLLVTLVFIFNTEDEQIISKYKEIRDQYFFEFHKDQCYDESSVCFFIFSLKYAQKSKLIESNLEFIYQQNYSILFSDFFIRIIAKIGVTLPNIVFTRNNKTIQILYDEIHEKMLSIIPKQVLINNLSTITDMIGLQTTIQYCSDNSIDILDNISFLIEENQMNDEIWEIFKKKSVRIPFKLHKFAIEKAKTSLPDAEYCFKYVGFALDESTQLKIFQESNNKDLLKGVNLMEILDIRNDNFDIWKILIEKFNPTDQLFSCFIYFLVDKLGENILKLLKEFDNNFEPFLHFLINFENSYPEASPTIIKYINESPQNESKLINKFIIYSITSLQGNCSLQMNFNINLDDANFDEIFNFLDSAEFIQNPLFVPQQMSEASKFFYYNAAQYWNLIHFSESKNHAFLPPSSKNVLFFVYTGCKIIDLLVKFTSKTRINGICYCKLFYDSIIDTITNTIIPDSHSSQEEIIDFKRKEICLNKILQYIPRDLQSMLKSKKTTSVEFSCDLIIALWRNGFVKTSSILFDSFSTALLALLHADFEIPVINKLKETFGDCLDPILMFLGDNSEIVIKNFLKKNIEYHNFRIYKIVRAQNVHQLIFNVFFCYFALKKEHAKYLIKLSRIVKRINHPVMTEKFLSAAQFIICDSVYAIIPFHPIHLYSPQNKELLLTKALSYVTNMPIDVISIEIDRVLMLLMDKNDEKLCQIYSLMAKRSLNGVKLHEILEPLGDWFLYLPPTAESLTMIYKPIERSTNLHFVFRDEINQINLTSNVFISFIESIINKIDDEENNNSLFILLMISLRSPLHFLYLENINLFMLFETICSLAVKSYESENYETTIQCILILKSLTQSAGIASIFIDWAFKILNDEINNQVFIILEVFLMLSTIEITNNSPSMKIALKGWNKFMERVFAKNEKLIQICLMIHKNILSGISRSNRQSMNNDKFIHAELSFDFIYKVENLFNLSSIFISNDIDLKVITEIKRTIDHNWNLLRTIDSLTIEICSIKQQNQNNYIDNVPDDIKLAFYQSVIPDVPRIISSYDIDIINKFPEYVMQYIIGEICQLETWNQYKDLYDCLKILDQQHQETVDAAAKTPQFLSARIFDGLTNISIYSNNKTLRKLSNQIISILCIELDVESLPIVVRIQNALDYTDVNLNYLSDLLAVLNKKMPRILDENGKTFLLYFQNKIAQKLFKIINMNLLSLTNESIINYMQILSQIKKQLDFDVTLYIKYILYKCVGKCEKLIYNIWDKMPKDDKSKLYAFILRYVTMTILSFDASSSYDQLILLPKIPENLLKKIEPKILNALEISLKNYHPGRAKSIIAMMNVLCPKRDHSGPLKHITQNFIEEQMKSNMRLRLPEPVFDDDYWSVLKKYENAVEMLSVDCENIKEILMFQWYPEIVSFPIKHKDFVKQQKCKIGPNYFPIDINRETILEDSINVILENQADDIMNSVIFVHFIGEKGIDEGGLFKDWISSFTNEVYSPNNNIFVQNEFGRFEPAKNGIKNEKIFYCLGMVLGRSLIEDIPMKPRMEPYFYKFLLQKRPTIRDVRQIDEDIYNSLIYIKDNDITDLCLTFSINIDGEIINLKENGSKIDVTNENKMEYVDLYIKSFVIKNNKNVYKTIAKGFYNVINCNDLSIFTPQELELALCGYAMLDVEDLIEACTIESPLTKGSDLIKMFFDVLRTFSNEELVKLVLFITGLSQIPSSGARSLQILISPGGEPPRLPTSHTCANMINLPYYKTKNEMEKMLKLAINNCNSFEFA